MHDLLSSTFFCKDKYITLQITIVTHVYEHSCQDTENDSLRVESLTYC